MISTSFFRDKIFHLLKYVVEVQAEWRVSRLEEVCSRLLCMCPGIAGHRQDFIQFLKIVEVAAFAFWCIRMLPLLLRVFVAKVKTTKCELRLRAARSHFSYLFFV